MCASASAMQCNASSVARVTRLDTGEGRFVVPCYVLLACPQQVIASRTSPRRGACQASRRQCLRRPAIGQRALHFSETRRRSRPPLTSSSPRFSLAGVCSRRWQACAERVNRRAVRLCADTNKQETARPAPTVSSSSFLGSDLLRFFDAFALAAHLSASSLVRRTRLLVATNALPHTVSSCRLFLTRLLFAYPWRARYATTSLG